MGLGGMHPRVPKVPFGALHDSAELPALVLQTLSAAGNSSPLLPAPGGRAEHIALCQTQQEHTVRVQAKANTVPAEATAADVICAMSSAVMRVARDRFACCL